jgi:hypothetical protein
VRESNQNPEDFGQRKDVGERGDGSEMALGEEAWRALGSGVG